MPVNTLSTRRSIRLRGYDYAQAGLYFVTMCTCEKQCTLGRAVGNHVELSSLGWIVRECWFDLPYHHARVELDRFVIMPNHFHGVFILHQLVGRRAQQAAPLRAETRVQPDSLAAIIRSFKAAVSRRAAHELQIAEPVWQRNYYEHIIRNGDDMVEIRRYIATNPAKSLDKENPDFG